jgi:hypothetical protein
LSSQEWEILFFFCRALNQISAHYGDSLYDLRRLRHCKGRGTFA